MSKDTRHRVWAGNWYRGGANWLENWLNGTLIEEDEPHNDRAMIRDAMTKLNQAADEIDRLYAIEKERDAAIEREQALAATLFDLIKEPFSPRANDKILTQAAEALKGNMGSALQRHTFIKQAEELEAFAEKISDHFNTQDVVVNRAYDDAAYLRQQAAALDSAANEDSQ